MLKHAEVMPSLAVAGSSKMSPSVTPTENGSSESSAVTQGGGRRRRKANFSSEEVDILVREVSARRFILFGSAVNGRSDVGSAAAKATEKLSAWRAVAASVNSANRGEPRTVREIRKKWENVTSTFRKRQLGDMGGATIELEPHILSGGRSPIDEVLACAKAYHANRLLQQQRRNAAAAASPFLEAFQSDENHMKEEYTSSDDDLILDIQPDVHIESLETPLTFTDSDEMNSRHENHSTHDNSHPDTIDRTCGDRYETEASYQGNRQLMQLQQQLKSGEVIISPAVHQAAQIIGNGNKRERGGNIINIEACTSASNIDKKQTIEEQKLAVMKQLLKIETKRLKVEKKRLKIEKIRLQMFRQNEEN